MDHARSVFAAELIAVEEALELAAVLGAIHIEVKTDAQLVMLALNNRSADCGFPPV
jgi:ribonuclease HI